MLKANPFASGWGLALTGGIIGTLAAVLQYWGNPPNMGVCVACFERDIAGALGLHSVGVVQYLRPEIPAFVLGAMVAALLSGEFRPRAGSGAVVRFVLGGWAMVGALVFLGCPWRALLRLAGGDLNAVAGLAGLVVGVWVATRFMRAGYSLGRARPAGGVVGWVLPAVMAGLVVLVVVHSGLIRYSTRGPGAMHAPVWVSLVVGGVVGFIAQRSRLCTMGAFRDLILFRQMHLMWGVIGLVGGAWLTNLCLGQFHPGIVNQPIAHSQGLWNFLGMVLAGLAFALAGGCPGRQLFMAGEGDGDAAVFVLGMIVAAALSHNFGLASSPKGIGPNAPVAVALGLACCLAIGFFARREGGR